MKLPAKYFLHELMVGPEVEANRALEAENAMLKANQRALESENELLKLKAEYALFKQRALESELNDLPKSKADAAWTILPSSSQNSNISPNLPASWLVEIHGQLWGRHDLFGQIFRTAKLSKTDFIELQHQLQELNPDRNSESYVAKDVLSTKSTFLRSRSTALPNTIIGHHKKLVPQLIIDASQPPYSDIADEDADHAEDLDGMEIDLDPHLTHLSNEASMIFPCTICYVDLTTLNMKKKPGMPQLMLFRKEWGTMIDVFNQRQKGILGSAIITGQPGIGKTCMLYTILFLCMMRAQSIVFQDAQGDVFIINETVYAPQNTPQNTPTVSEDVDDVLTLIDADGPSCQPNPYLFKDVKYRILLTSSPRDRSDRKWLTHQVDDEDAVIMMEPWSREECVVASLFLQSIDITLKRFQDASNICGNIPRRCFKAARSPAYILNAKTEIDNAVQDIHKSHDVIAGVKRGDTIDRVFQIYPSNSSRIGGSCVIQPVSDWALSVMMKELRRRNQGAAYKLYHALQGSPSSSTLVGRMFETSLHLYLKTPRVYIIKSLDDRRTTLDIYLTSNTVHAAFVAMKDFSRQLASSVKDNRSCYLKSSSPVFPSFDSFLYQPILSQSLGFSALISLQVTTAADHAISIKGLEKIQQSLKLKVPELKGLRPTMARKMIILFVVPDTLGAAFVKQRIKDAGKAGCWHEKTAQYILELPEEAVLRATE